MQMGLNQQKQSEEIWAFLIPSDPLAVFKNSKKYQFTNLISNKYNDLEIRTFLVSPQNFNEKQDKYTMDPG